jgi:hypothetical protein
MEYLNDEMDDLFRKAGEHYPLKTTDSDWNGVLGRLQPPTGDEHASALEAGGRRNKKRKFFWLLLLLPLSLISIKYFSGSEGKKSTHSTSQTSATPLKNSENNHSENAQHPADNLNIKISHVEEIKPENTLHYSRNADANSLYADMNTKTTANNSGISEEKSTLSPTGNKEDLTVEPVEVPDATAKTEKPASILPGMESAVQANTNQAEKPAQSVSGKTTADQTNSNQKNKKPAKVASAKEKGIYLSLVAAPDFSTVKFQSVKNIGYTIGLLAGYRFSRHISLETGILWDKKQYYSEGQYFNKSKTDIPPSVSILDLNGNCNMFEIPVSFRYDFSFNRKGRFFSTAGLSTYIMKKENYTYDAESYGSAWSQQVSYNNSGNNFFSILQLSAGYEYNWGKIGRIRIEPYFKIPLTGVGIGSLPISSAGLQLGITHPFR